MSRDWNQRILESLNNFSQNMVDTYRNELTEMRNTIFTPPLREMTEVSREVPLFPRRNRTQPSQTTGGNLPSSWLPWNRPQYRSESQSDSESESNSFSEQAEQSNLRHWERQRQHYFDFLANLNPTGTNTTRLNPLPTSARQHIQVYSGEPLRCFLSTMEKTNCPICLDPIRPGSKSVSVLPCGHLFHTECIDTWWQSNTECPTCRLNPVDGIPQTQPRPSESGPANPVPNLETIRIRRRDGTIQAVQFNFNRTVSDLLAQLGCTDSVLIMFNQRLPPDRSLVDAGVKPNDLLVEWVN